MYSNFTQAGSSSGGGGGGGVGGGAGANRYNGGAIKTVIVPNFGTLAGVSMSNRNNQHHHPRSSSSGPRPGPGSSRQEKTSYWRNNARTNDFAPTKYYCEVCCCDCVGKGSYEAHMVGQQHMKKVKLAAITTTKAGTASAVRAAENFCEVCNCACTNPDAFNAHLRGQKHQKAMKLYAKLGKPIPESLKPQVVKVIPKTNFTTGGTLNTLTGKMEGNARELVKQQQASSSSHVTPAAYPGVSAVPVNASATKDDKPKIGEECIIEERNAEGKVINYKCNICGCDMNNAFMRDDHLKGRKHLTEYKMKVNPHLKVNDKKLQGTFQQIEKLRIQAEQEELRKREYREQGMRNKLSQRERELLAAFPGHVQVSSVHSADDRLIMKKHVEVNPTETEIQAGDKFVTNIESTLKAVSDALSAARDDKVKDLKGVMRIGAFAKGIMLKGEKSFEVVVLCDKKPSEALGQSICTTMGEKLIDVFKDETFDISWSAKKASITIKSQAESAYECVIHITSPQIRDDQDTVTDPVKPLNKTVCSKSLAETRRAKWFDSKSKQNPSLSIIVRILRDLCRRIPTWNSFPCYVIELLCDKALRTVAHDMGPAELLRKFFELIAAGVLLPNDNGVYDPCEKNNTNAAGDIKMQDSQDITTSSQHALRLIALNQTDKILGQISATPSPSSDMKRKIPSEDSTSTKPIPSKPPLPATSATKYAPLPTTNSVVPAKKTK